MFLFNNYTFKIVYKEYEDIGGKCFKEAMDRFPSKEYYNKDEKKWLELVEKQKNYQILCEDTWLESLKERYKLNDVEWNRLVTKLRTKSLKEGLRKINNKYGA